MFPVDRLQKHHLRLVVRSQTPRFQTLTGSCRSNEAGMGRGKTAWSPVELQFTEMNGHAFINTVKIKRTYVRMP